MDFVVGTFQTRKKLQILRNLFLISIDDDKSLNHILHVNLNLFVSFLIRRTYHALPLI